MFIQDTFCIIRCFCCVYTDIFVDLNKYYIYKSINIKIKPHITIYMVHQQNLYNNRFKGKSLKKNRFKNGSDYIDIEPNL